MICTCLQHQTSWQWSLGQREHHTLDAAMDLLLERVVTCGMQHSSSIRTVLTRNESKDGTMPLYEGNTMLQCHYMKAIRWYNATI